MVILVTVTVDVAGVYYADAHVKRVVDTATRNVLAEYDTKLKESYGLYGVSEDELIIEEKIKFYVTKMLNENKGISSSFLSRNYDVRDIKVNTSGLELNNKNIFEEQVVNEMKYKGPLGVAIDFSKKVDLVKSTSNSMELLKGAEKIFQTLYEINSDLNVLRSQVDGWSYSEDYEIKIKINDSFLKKIQFSKNIFNEYKFLNSQQSQQIESLTLDSKDMINLKVDFIKEVKSYYIASYKYEYYLEAKNALERKKYGLSDEDTENIVINSQLNRVITNIDDEKEIIKSSKAEIENYSKIFIRISNACNIAIKKIDLIMVKTEKVKELIVKMQDNIETNKDTLLPDLLKSMEAEILSISKIVETGNTQSYKNIINIVENNKDAIERYINGIDIKDIGKEQINYNINLENPVKSDSYFEMKLENNESYKDWNISLSRAYTTLKTNYKTDFSIEPFALPKLNNGQTSNENSFSFDVVKKNISKEVKKLITKVIYSNEIKNGAVSGFLPSKKQNIETTHNINTDIGEIEIKTYEETKEKNIGEYALETIPQFSKMLSGIRDEIYVNEYILTSFNNIIKTNDTNKSFYKNEAEYVLFGNPKDDVNKNAMINRLTLTRTGLNLIHIYSDPIKRSQVTAAAATITAGVGTYFVHFLISTIWANAEAVLDVEKLLDGEEVAFIKTEDDWVLGIDNLPESLPETKNDNNDGSKPKLDININKFSYEDYLRLFLLLENNDEKIYRTMDLVQINMIGNIYKDFQLRDYYGGIEVDANIKVDYIFINKKKFLDQYKLEDKNISVKVTHTYN